MKAILSLLLWGILLKPSFAGMIEVEYDPQARLLDEYKQVNTHDVVADLTADLEPDPFIIGNASRGEEELLSFNTSAENVITMPETVVSYQDLDLIKHLFGANKQLIKVEYLKFKQDITEYIGLSAQAKITTAAVYDEVLISEPLSAVNFQHERIDSSIQFEEPVWYIKWFKAAYKWLTSPENLIILLISLSVAVLLKRRFWAQ
ncbi:hypothetical protein Q4519_15025 [Motilimonas sp. 1_MG-2023]|uniref:hypothetical protein n=1 Tax=Motilimonas sp. 1_MG-2023 TaxID=3062672 RepID=UPI0026E3EC07|nr:hypothetical protein [Motilimonas sp. 1_MG-2023]MDO6526991.1 hypothetical protein [Motilimonas sp. 1_MG-2023]